MHSFYYNGATAPGNGIRVGYYAFGSANDTSMRNSALIKGVTSEAWTYGTNHGTDVVLESAVAGSGSTTRTEKLRIDSIGRIHIIDGVTAPTARTGFAQIYVDTADGDLKVMFGDGTVKTIVTDV